jgi:hypothetical protein
MLLGAILESQEGNVFVRFTAPTSPRHSLPDDLSEDARGPITPVVFGVTTP